MMRLTTLFLVALVTSPSDLLAGEAIPVITLSINQYKVAAEVVATPEQRANGLMNRFSLQPDHGMVFVFDRPQPLGFWMKNTYVPLSIAFIDASGKIVNIEDMKPLDESTVWSRGPSLYALEMRQGWFAAKGVGPGDTVRGLPPAASR
jgi:uncharacterized protein